MISRENALKFLNENIENKNIVKHMLATEALMRAVARKFQVPSTNFQTMEKISEEEWGIVGLLHDGDYKPDIPVEKQGIEVTEILRKRGFEIPDSVAHAMAAHNHMTGVTPVSKMDWSLYCGDSLTGLIVAGVLVLPSKKLADLTVESVLRRYREPSFARGTRRDEIALCEEKLGIPLPEFVGIVLQAMQGISGELGL